MKKLQQNFTTTEQSKRLLELGLPADSADCYYDTYDIEHSNCLRPYFLDERTYTDYFKHLSCIGTNVHCPCWSVGRLIEIYHICVSRGFSFNVCFPNLMNEIMYKLGEANSNGWLDIKKLEE